MSTVHHHPDPTQTPAPNPVTLDHLALLTTIQVAGLTGATAEDVSDWIATGELRSTRHPDSWGRAEEIAALPAGAVRVCVNDLDLFLKDRLGWNTGEIVGIGTPASEYLCRRLMYWRKRQRRKLKFKPPQWLADPTGRHESRYWNGLVWTFSVRDGDVESEHVTNLPDVPQVALSASDVRGAPIDWEAHWREEAQVKALADQVFDLYVKRSREGRADDAQRALTLLENLCQPVGMGGLTAGWRGRDRLRRYVHDDLLSRDPWPPPVPDRDPIPPLPAPTPQPLRPCKGMPAAKRERIAQLWAAGKSWENISERTGWNDIGVRGVLRRATVAEMIRRGVAPDLAKRLQPRMPLGATFEVNPIDREPLICVSGGLSGRPRIRGVVSSADETEPLCSEDTDPLFIVAPGVHACGPCLQRAGAEYGSLVRAR
jgi:hypothetical protein